MVDSFLDNLTHALGSEEDAYYRRKRRIKLERRAANPHHRSKGGRSHQLCFRCTPAFYRRVHELVALGEGDSVADVLQKALDAMP